MTRRPLVFALVVVLLATGCSSGQPDRSGTSDPPTAEASPQGFEAPRPLTTDEAIGVLAASGIGVFEDVDSAKPEVAVTGLVSPLVLLRFQADNLAREATAGGGVSGAQIDEMLPMPADTVPLSALLAGYVATAQTPGSRFVAERMHGQDLTRLADLWFPTITLPLFVGEVLAAVPATGGLPTVAPSPAALAALEGVDLGRAPTAPGAFDPCGDFSRFFNGVLKAIPDAILSHLPHIPFLSAALEWALTKGIGMAVDLAKELVGHIPFLETLKKGIQGLAIAGSVLETFRSWNLRLTIDPASPHYSVAGSPTHVRVTGVIDDGPADPLPQAFRNCANAMLDEPLPAWGAPGSAGTWKFLLGAGHAQPGWKADAQVGADRRVGIEFDVVEEPLEYHLGGRLASQPLQLLLTIKRQDAAKLKSMADRMIAGLIGRTAYGLITSFFGDPLGRIAAMTNVSGSRTWGVTYHTKPDPPPPPADDGDGTGVEPPPADGNGGTGGSGSEFCRRWKALVEWAGAQREADELERKWAIHMAEELEGMKPYAPPEMRPWVNLLLDAYFPYAAAPSPVNIPQAGRGAVRIPEAMRAINRHCGVSMEGLS